MKSPKALVAAIFAAAFLCPQVYAGASLGDPSHLHWNYAAPFTVNEQITDLGKGNFKYSYNFTNSDTSPIYLFGVYTTFLASDATKFTGHENWQTPVFRFVDSVYHEYDARGLDPAIEGFVGVYNTEGLPPNPSICIQTGEAAYGFSFIASTIIADTSPKYFFYETMDSGYTQTNGTGAVAAVGQTVYVPEPTTMVLLVGSLMGLCRVRRRK